MPEGVGYCEKKTVPGSLPHLEPHPLRPRPSSGSFGVHYRLLLLGGAHSPLTEVQQPERIPHPEVVGAANSPTNLGGTAPPSPSALDTSAAKANGAASYHCTFLPAFLIFLLCLQTYSLTTPVVRGPCGRFGECGFSGRELNAGWLL